MYIKNSNKRYKINNMDKKDNIDKIDGCVMTGWRNRKIARCRYSCRERDIYIYIDIDICVRARLYSYI